MAGTTIQSSGMRSVVVVTASALDVAELVQIRDYIVESIGLGVLALADDMALRVEQLPEVAGVQVEHILEDTSTQVAPSTPSRAEELAETIKSAAATKKSAEAQEKESILRRLKAYRESKGLGCFEPLAQKYGGRGKNFTSDTLRSMLNSRGSIPIETWRKVGKALEKEERSGVANG